MVDPDVLTYTLDDETDAASFDIDSGTGQIRVKAGPTRTSKPSPATPSPSQPRTRPTLTNTEFEDSITVTIMVTDVDETPMFTAGATEVDHDENDSSDTVDYVPELSTYTATDPEDDQDVTRI